MDRKEQLNADIEIDIWPLLKALLSKIWLMVIIGATFAGIAFGATKMFVKPTYRSGFSAYVNNQQVQATKDVLTSSDVTAAKELVRTYSQILKSNTILTTSAESIDLNYSYDTLKKMVVTQIQDDTEIISVYVVHTDPMVAYDLACAIAATSPEHMANIVEGSSMKIIDQPMYNTNRYKPSYTKYAILGFLIGALLVAVRVIIKYFTNDTVMNEGDVESRFGLPILGVIPDLTSSGRKSTDYYSYEYGYGAAQSSTRERSAQTHEK